MGLAPGTRIGSFEIIGLIGAGGMGEVYRARDSRLGRLVAIKILNPTVAANAEGLKRFAREARSLAALNHPNIAQVHGFEEVTSDQGVVHALVMEHVEGQSLASQAAGRPMRWSSVKRIAEQLIDALDASHTAGIVHRDLKPANICLTEDGVVKVIDFGIAQAASPAVDARTQSVTGSRGVVGTAHYMSPEQARGAAVDRRTDIWSFGVVLYELLTGKHAFAGETWTDTIVSVIEREPDWSLLPEDVPVAVKSLLKRCLTKDVKDRLRDIADARVEIELSESAAASPRAQPRRATIVPWLIAAGMAAVTLALWWVPPRIPPAAPSFGRAVRFTNGPAVELGPTVSPDGQWVAYFSDVRGPTDIIVQYVAGGESINLTASSALQLPTRIDLGGMAISPDGAFIAFDAGGKPGTPANLFDAWVIPAPLGGVARKLVERGRGLRWSPDGKRIAYVRAGAAAGDSLYVANADGSNERQIVPTTGGMHVHWCSWAIDGSSIYFAYSISTANSEPTEIFKVPSEGGTLEPVIRTARRAVYPVPFPDGSGILYAANPDTSDLGLWWQAPDKTSHRITAGIGEYAEPSVSRNGDRLAATLIDWNRTIVSLSLETSGATRIAPLVDGMFGDLDPSVSIDGKHVVFSSARAGNRTLWAMSLDEKKPRPLTSGPVFDERPVLSPDGRRVAFVSDREGRRGIWLMNADGGAPRRVTFADVLDGVGWSPDGTRLVYAAPAGPAPGLWIVTVADGNVRRLETQGPATSPAWAPGRDVIAYVEARPPSPDAPNSSRVAAMDSAGRSIEVAGASNLNVLNGFLAWSSDGRYLIAIVDPGSLPTAVWMADTTLNRPFQRVYEAPPHTRFRGAAWLPGSMSVLLGQMRRDADVVLFERLREPRP